MLGNLLSKFLAMICTQNSKKQLHCASNFQQLNSAEKDCFKLHYCPSNTKHCKKIASRLQPECKKQPNAVAQV